MIFQDPLTSLNPCYTVALPADGSAATSTARRGARQRRRVRRTRARVAASRSRFPIPQRGSTPYPHQLSGGMAQRVMIAMAHRLQPEAADRRRADDGARRDRAGQVLVC